MTLVLVGHRVAARKTRSSAGGPLYGRRTGTIDLPLLDLADAKQCYPADESDAVI